VDERADPLGFGVAHQRVGGRDRRGAQERVEIGRDVPAGARRRGGIARAQSGAVVADHAREPDHLALHQQPGRRAVTRAVQEDHRRTALARLVDADPVRAHVHQAADGRERRVAPPRGGFVAPPDQQASQGQGDESSQPHGGVRDVDESWGMAEGVPVRAHQEDEPPSIGPLHGRDASPRRCGNSGRSARRASVASTVSFEARTGSAMSGNPTAEPARHPVAAARSRRG
jgi:hypothetical protein